MKTPLELDEIPLYDGGANHQRGWETVGGRLYLTSRRLIFEPHAMNVQTAVQHWPVAEISSAEPCWTKFLGLIPLMPNSIAVTIGGTEQRFVLWGRATWLAKILAARSP